MMHCAIYLMMDKWHSAGSSIMDLTSLNAVFN